MKKILMVGLLLCGGSFSLFGMNCKKLAWSGFAGAMMGVFVPALINPSFSRQLIEEKPEAYAGMILFGGMIGVGYELLSGSSKSKVAKPSSLYSTQKPIDTCNLQEKITLKSSSISEFYVIKE